MVAASRDTVRAVGLGHWSLAGALALVALAAGGEPVEPRQVQAGDAGGGELVELRRSYVVLVDGEQQGTVDHTLRRHPDGIPPEGVEDAEGDGAIWESTSTMSAPLQEQERRVVFAEDGLRPLLMEQWETRGDDGAEVSLRVDGGRVRGRVALPGIDPEPRRLDLDLPEGSLFPGMDDYLLATADLVPDVRIGAPMLDLAEGGVTTVSFHVEGGPEMVEVPAGSFEVFRVRLEGGPRPLTLLVKAEEPHVVVRQEYPGQPLALELTYLDEGAR